MIADIFTLLKASSAVVGLLQSGAQLKAYRDRAPQNGDGAVTVAPPYLVHRVVGGVPYNMLADAPGMDYSREQFDIYAETQDSADTVYEAVRDALEAHGYIVSFNGNGRDPETNRYRISFDMSFHVPR